MKHVIAIGNRIRWGTLLQICGGKFIVDRTHVGLEAHETVLLNTDARNIALVIIDADDFSYSLKSMLSFLGRIKGHYKGPILAASRDPLYNNQLYTVGGCSDWVDGEMPEITQKISELLESA